MRTAFINALCEAAEHNPNLWLLAGDLGYSVLEVFAQRFPKRYLNVGVAEQNMVGVAAGLAMSGKTVVTYSIVNFATLRCLEQIRCDVCYHGADVKIVGVGGGYAYGSLGYTHHGIEDLAILATLPSIDVVAPGDPLETRLAVRALFERKGPAYLRLGKAGEPAVHAAEPTAPRGAVIRARDGADALLITTGGLLVEAVAAADAWTANTGRRAAVWSCPWLRPFDTAAIEAAATTFPVIISAEEGVVTGGLAAAVARAVSSVARRRAHHVAVGVPPDAVPASLSQKAARARFGLDAAALLAQLNASVA